MNDWESWHPEQNTSTEEVTEAVLDEHEQHATALHSEPEAAAPQPATEVEQVQQPPQQPQVEELRELNLAIEIYPEVAANYLLRAELYVEQQAWALAEDDFKTALRLANEQLEESAWGIAEQGIIDAALRGLQQLKNYW